MKICVYGGQYGSEGKGAAAEFFAKQVNGPLAVVGDNSPNSGHTCSLGKTRNIPASSFWATYCFLGPDAVIDERCLWDDCEVVLKCNPGLKIFIHAQAAVLDSGDVAAEWRTGLDKTISSTCSGSGSARYHKFYHRAQDSIIGNTKMHLPKCVELLDTNNWFIVMDRVKELNWIFECSQGVMLDTNFGLFPHVTSRSTLPRVAIERNGVGAGRKWKYAGVYRTYPIRTGGPSGPTGGEEINWRDLGVPPEIATVTGRVRRVFDFSDADFNLSLGLTRPDIVMFTHVDYLKCPVGEWVAQKISHLRGTEVYYSSCPGKFEYYGKA